MNVDVRVTYDISDLLHASNALNIFEINWEYLGLNYFNYYFVIFIFFEKCYAEGVLTMEFDFLITNSLILYNKLKGFFLEGQGL